MNLVCSRCGRVLEFSGERPLFCGFCGSQLPKDDPGSTAEYGEATALRDPAVTPRVGAQGDASYPESLGGYRLLRELGKGGMGAVFEAEDSASGRRVAVKVIAQHFINSPETVDRFRQEGRLASGISHPRCVFVLGADEDAGTPFIVMELMSGSTLKDLVTEKGPLDPTQAVKQILDVIEGLAEAHRLGVIHRDVKPSNCFLQADGRVKVGDFGLSKALGKDSHLTKTGTFLGTPLFASPEQVRSEPLDQRTDVYSVAATLYFLLTGQAPFEGGDAASTLARISADPPPPMRSLRPDLSAALDRVVLRGLERQRERRWQDLEEFRAALTPFVPGQLSFGGLGIRLGAGMLDLSIVAVLGLLPVFLAWVFDWGARFEFLKPEQLQSSLVGKVLGLVPVFLYFALLEGLWGRSLGKAWLRLRVCANEGQQTPGLVPGAWRALLFLVIVYGPFVVLTAFLGPITQQEYSWIAISLAIYLAGLVIMACPMRARNGYRGLHELLSGTRVIHLRWKVRRKNYAGQTDLPLTQLEEMPRQLGPFPVQGALRWTGEEKVLQGVDPVLRRKVWLWLRPASAPPLSPARLELVRATRLRWLTGGKQGKMQWEAFQAPTGCQLAEAIAVGGPWTWTEARPLLEELSEELTLALAEGSLPLSLNLDHVWVQSNGRIQLVDLPLPESKCATADAAATDTLGVLHLLGQTAALIRADLQVALKFEKNVIRLLGQVAVLVLAGKPRGPDQLFEPLPAPLPDHARSLLDRLVGVSDPYRELTEFQEDLAATAGQATEVTRLRRAAQLALVGLCFWAGASSSLDPFRLTGADLRMLGILVAWPLLWIVLALLTRGGLSFRMTGLRLVRTDGRKAALWQCALRALLFWLPIMTFLIGSLLVNSWYLGRVEPEPTGVFAFLPWLATGLNVAALLMLPLYLYLALRNPAQSWHDRVVGTYLVPR